jgi:DNA-binding transcriptional LysR family regulator
MSTDRLSWDLYGTFLAVMKHGSLSAASRELGVAQPTVRRQIEKLEEELGVVLFTRAPNGLLPTETATATLPYAEAMASQARAFVRSVSASPEEERGTVRITASEVIGAEVLPAALAQLATRYPRIQVELALSNRNADLVRRDADIAVRMMKPTQSGLAAKRIGVVEVGFYASPSYLARAGTPRTLEGLKEHALVGSDRERALLEGLERAGLSLTPRDFHFRSDSDLAQLAAIRAGLGIGPCQVALAEAPPLVRVLSKYDFKLEMWLVAHEDLRAQRRVRAVLDVLSETLTAYVNPRKKPRASR